MNCLESSYHAQGWIKMSGNKYPIKQLPVDEIWASVPKAEKHRSKEFYRPVLKDIKANGLKFPIMVIDSTRAAVCAQKNKWKNKLCELPFPHQIVKKQDERTDKWLCDIPENNNKQVYVCWGGSQRLRIARELGYTHIDCAMMPSYKIAHNLQKVMRAPYKDRWYK